MIIELNKGNYARGWKGGRFGSAKYFTKIRNTFNCVNFIFHCGYLLPFLALFYVVVTNFTTEISIVEIVSILTTRPVVNHD
jgi:hypothetical protein